VRRLVLDATCVAHSHELCYRAEHRTRRWCCRVFQAEWQDCEREEWTATLPGHTWLCYRHYTHARAMSVRPSAHRQLSRSHTSITQSRLHHPSLNLRSTERVQWLELVQFHVQVICVAQQIFELVLLNPSLNHDLCRSPNLMNSYWLIEHTDTTSLLM